MGYSGSKEEETELRPQDLFHMSSLGGGYMAWVGHLRYLSCLCQESSPANGPSTDSEVLAWPSVLLHGFWGLGSDSCERVSCLAPSTDRKAPEIGATISIVSLLNFLFFKNWKPSEKLQEYYRELPYTLHLDFPIVKHVLYLLHLFLSTL